MKLEFGMLIMAICIFAVCFWFVNVGIRENSYYRQVYHWFIGVAIVMYLNRILELCMRDGYIVYSEKIHFFERALYYSMTMIVYVLYAYFIICFIHQLNIFSLRKKIMFFAPCGIMTVLVLTSYWTHFFFHIEDGVLCKDIGFWFILLTRIVYGVGATIYAIAKRHIMPKIFWQSAFLATVFALIQTVHNIITKDDYLYYITMTVNVIIFTLTIAVVEFYKDNLTGLLNHEAFEEYIQREMDKGATKTVYLIKLKNYEYIRNNWHEAGLLTAIAKMGEDLREIAKVPTIYYLDVGRYAVIVRKKDSFSEQEFFDKIKESMNATVESSDVNIHKNLFIAVINVEREKLTKNTFYKYFAICDEWKYRSNAPIEIVQGDSLGVDEVQRYRNIEGAIERALLEKEFKMFYQPIFSTEKKKVISAEALIRLNDRVMGYISPEEFIPISENNGKILEISEYVIDSVFRFISEHPLHKLGLEFIEVNLSVMQCMDKHLTKKLEYYIQKYNIDPRQINLEITETATNNDEDGLKKQLHKLKKLGFSFSLDDYGTGYSNLVRVLEYPVDVIKLDKSIVWSAFHDQDSFTTLKNLISMFHDVRRKIVAEGVETQEQKEVLRELGCDYLQGYYYSKPISEEEFIQYVREQQKEA